MKSRGFPNSEVLATPPLKPSRSGGTKGSRSKSVEGEGTREELDLVQPSEEPTTMMNIYRHYIAHTAGRDDQHLQRHQPEKINAVFTLRVAALLPERPMAEQGREPRCHLHHNSCRWATSSSGEGRKGGKEWEAHASRVW